MEQHLSDNSTEILFQHASNVIWVQYNKLHVSNYRKVHHDEMRRGCPESGKSEKSMHVHFAVIAHRTLRGLGPKINPISSPELSEMQ